MRKLVIYLSVIFASAWLTFLTPFQGLSSEIEPVFEQTVEPFHDVAVKSVVVEPKTFETGKATFIVATIANSGTYSEEKCDVIFYEITGRVKKELGRQNAVRVIDTLKVNFEWKPEDLIGNVRFQVVVSSENDSNNYNNSRMTNKFSIRESENLNVLHAQDPAAVHQWVVYQAKSLWSNSEMDFYLPSIWSNDVSTLNNKEITYGAWLEDADTSSEACYPHNSCEPCLGTDFLYHPYCHHFWNPDGGEEAGLYWVKQWDSAYRRAQTLWDDKVIPNYNSGNKAEAYQWLGRVAHLLTDMSVPAHVHLDVHIGDPISGDDNYEDYMTEFNDDVSNDYNYKQWTASGAVATSVSSLYDLFYHMAEIADDFDSDDYPGEVDGGERERDLLGDITYEECRNIGDVLMPKAMEHLAGLYQLFWNTTHGTSSIIYVSKDNFCSANTPCFPNIQNGIASAFVPSIIRITEETYFENILLDFGQAITLQGGWGADFSSESSYTTIDGSITIISGTMILEGVILR
jgi:hypothetical protein